MKNQEVNPVRKNMASGSILSRNKGGISNSSPSQKVELSNGVKVAIFDLDGTLVSRHVWLGIVKYNLKEKENLFPVFWYIFYHMALIPFWKIGFLSQEEYYKSWGQDIATMIKGKNQRKTSIFFQWLAKEYLLPSIKKNILKRLKEHQKKGFSTILLSGSFQGLLNIIANQLNINFAIGTKLEIKKDKFSGRIVPPLCFGKQKVEKLENFLSQKKLKVNFKESFAYSDSIFDLPMLKLVGHPVVVEPDKELLKIASKNSWETLQS